MSADDIKSQGVPLDDGVTLIGFEPIISSEFVHHYSIHGSLRDSIEQGCDTYFEKDLLYMWLKGKGHCVLVYGKTF